MKSIYKLKKRKLVTSIILLSWAISLNSCRTPPDVYAFETFEQRLMKDPATGHIIMKPSPYCMKHISEPSCCHGVSIVRGREIYVGEEEKNFFNKKSCSTLIKESVHLPAIESFAPLTTFLINECKRNKCDKEIEKFKIKLDGLTAIKEVIENADTPLPIIKGRN